MFPRKVLVTLSRLVLSAAWSLMVGASTSSNSNGNCKQNKRTVSGPCKHFSFLHYSVSNLNSSTLTIHIYSFFRLLNHALTIFQLQITTKGVLMQKKEIQGKLSHHPYHQNINIKLYIFLFFFKVIPNVSWQGQIQMCLRKDNVSS